MSFETSGKFKISPFYSTHLINLFLDDKNSQLLEIIQSYEYLYDLSHVDYKNNKKKESAWEKIGIFLEKSGMYKVR